VLTKLPKVAVVVTLPPPNIDTVGALKKGSVIAGNVIAVITPDVNVHVVVWNGTFPDPEITIVGGEVKPVPPFVIVNPVIILAAVTAVIFMNPPPLNDIVGAAV
jgi:hypothetical protein